MFFGNKDDYLRNTVLATENIRKEYKQRAKAIRNRGLTNILPKVQVIEKINYRTVTDMDTIIEFFLPLFSGERTVCAFDIETSPTKEYRQEEKAALDPHKSDICGISFCHTPGDAIYIPVAYLTIDKDVFLEFLDTNFFKGSFVKIAQNISFESMFFYKHGIVLLPPVYDTWAAAQLTLSSPYAFRDWKNSGLKTLSNDILKVKQQTFEEVTQGKHFDELDPFNSDVVRYACEDSDFALRLYYYFEEWFSLNIPEHAEYCLTIDSPACVCAGIMKYNGLTVNSELMQEQETLAVNKIEEIRARIDSYIGKTLGEDKQIDIGKNASTKIFKSFLFDIMKCPVMTKTETGQASTDDAAFQSLEEYFRNKKDEEAEQFFRDLQEYRKWGKLNSTYIEGIKKQVNAATGQVHTDLMPTVTDTSRFASRNPNMQNLPRKDNDPIGVRNFFIAREGHVFIDFDFSQIELRVGAFYCKDKKMVDTYINGGDIHAQTTAVIYHIPLEQAQSKASEHYKERRTIAKNCNFGVFFGLFPSGLQRNLKFEAGLDTSMDECEEIINNLKAGYPGIVKWQNEVKKEAAEKTYTKTLFGFHRILKGILSNDWGVKSFWERVALNTPIQGTAAAILKKVFTRLLYTLIEKPWLLPVLQVHDELLFECPIDKLSEAYQIIKEIMEVSPGKGFDIPIKTEGSYGFSFGKLEEIEL